MSDPGSLQNLNDVLLPAPVGWWPPAPGWFVVAALLLVALGWLAARRWRRWSRNRYRREALRSLAQLRAGGAAAARGVPELLKRAALSAWPRDAVAALSGDDWHRFLDGTARMSCFCGSAGRTLDSLAYGAAEPLPADEAEDLYREAERWLRRHRAPQEAA